MASVEQRLQLKREPLDKWSVREQLCLASAVARSGDQNWMSVSRSLKPFGDPNRPSDWFHQKNCAAQYGALLANVETPKRKKRTSGGDFGIETPAESIFRQLKNERIAELRKLLAEERAEYLKLQENMAVLSSGKFTEDQLDRWCKEIDDEENRKELETMRHSQWLKERETRKLEIERAWRPAKPSTPQMPNQLKRKNSESFDVLMETDQQHLEDNSSNSNPPIQESPKPQLSLSPLLTSLLKSPSQVQNINQASILHSAITNQRPAPSNAQNMSPSISSNTSTNPMIASLLNSTTNVAVSPGLQHLVSTAIGQETENVTLDLQNADLATPDILDDETLRNLKIEDITNSIIVPDGPLPEMKNDVDVIISDLIADPEQHLQLDNNGDININLELDDLDEADLDPEPEEKLEEQVVEEAPIIIQAPIVTEPEKPVVEKIVPVIDPFEFQEDPEYEPKIPMKQPDQSKIQLAPVPPPQAEPPEQPEVVVEETVNDQVDVLEASLGLEDEVSVKEKEDEAAIGSGSVEIVEVAVEEEEIGKVLDKTQIQDIVHTSRLETELEVSRKEVEDSTEVEENVTTVKVEELEETEKNEETEEALTEQDQVKVEVKEEEEERQVSPVDSQTENQLNISLEIDKTSDSITIEQHNFSDELYDDVQMEVKIDKTGKAKRDYSRTKKKEEKEFDILLAIEKAHMEENELLDDLSDREFSERSKEETKKDEPKSENERSNSPWTEEEDVSSVQSKRRISTPATPSDSVPNSPASSSAYYDDDKEYRNWKKSIMLVYSWLAAHKYSSLFLKPITDEQAPGYHNMIYRPMDFHTLRKNIENGVIRTTQEFKRDVMLMLNNAIMYNKTNGTVYNMTRELQQEAVESIQLLLQAQSSEDAPPRRETRLSEPGLKRKRVSDENVRSKKRKEE